MDPDPVCPERLDPDTDQVCPERLDPDPVNIRPDPQPCWPCCCKCGDAQVTEQAFLIIHFLSFLFLFLRGERRGQFFFFFPQNYKSSPFPIILCFWFHFNSFSFLWWNLEKEKKEDLKTCFFSVNRMNKLAFVSVCLALLGKFLMRLFSRNRNAGRLWHSYSGL